MNLSIAARNMIALGSSTLLIAGFVCYRAGLLDRFVGSPPKSDVTLLHGSKAIDTPSLVPDPLGVPPTIPSVIDEVSAKQ
jgi:hypothetical protein